MPAVRTPLARHARLFELIRQGNMIARAAERRQLAQPPKVDLRTLARKAVNSLSR